MAVTVLVTMVVVHLEQTVETQEVITRQVVEEVDIQVEMLSY